MWFDYSFDDFTGEKWQAEKLVSMVRKHQPNIILNNRLKTHAGSASKQREISDLGDFETPEQGIPDYPLLDKYDNSIPWETCLTLNNSWGYNEFDNNWKSPELIIHSLVNAVSKNGNLLLNVGPDAKGNIPNESVNILKEVGDWLQLNGESVYGCGAAANPKPDWGRYTQKDNLLFSHWLYPNIGDLNVSGVIAAKVDKVILLNSGVELPYSETWWGNMEPGNFFIKVGNSPDKPVKYNTVVKIKYKNDY
jgi:alpha-L-fucosidase